MTEKYRIYREMMDDIPYLEKRIRESLREKDYQVYEVFLAVQDEDTRQYFCDIEYGGEPDKYNRIYRRMTKEELIKMFYLNEERTGSEIDFVDEISFVDEEEDDDEY